MPSPSTNADNFSFFERTKPLLKIAFFCSTVRLGINELLNKEQIGFKELFTDYQLFYTINLLLNKELLPI